MNLSLVSPFVYLASEKISAENLFEGFNVDLQSTVDLIKSLSSYNPTVWTYMSSITKSVMQHLGVAILSVVLILEFSKMAKKIANSGGAMTFEALAPMLISYIMVAVVITNTTVIVEAIIGKFNRKAKDYSCLRIVQWGFRCILWITGVETTVIGEE